MSDAIYFNALTGQHDMAYVGEKGWHGLGNLLTADATMEDWLKASGMEYEVNAAGVQFENGTMHTFPNKRVLYRNDTFAPLGIVSDAYKVVQPREVLEFFRDLCSDQGMTLETAGVLKGGALYWALAKTAHSMTIGRDDRHDAYALMSTSADGTRATDNRLTDVRVVCQNTLNLALGKGSKSNVKTRHNTTFDAAATKEKMGLISHKDAWEKFADEMHKLADRKVTQAEATEFFSELLRPAASRAKPRAELKADNFASLLSAPFGGAVSEATVTDKDERAIRGLADLQQSYVAAPGAVVGTAYGLLQGVTHYVDHVRGADDGRRVSAWFGQGDTLKSTALETLLAM